MKILSKTMSKSILTTGLIAATLSSSFVLTGCGGVSNEQTHTIAGSVIGGVIGRQFGVGSGRDLMTVVGVVVGGMIGANMGRGLDQQDQRNVNQTLETAPNYQKVAWNNQNTNTQYEFTPVNGAGQQCRDYIMDAWIDGRMQQVKGRACKNDQGQWVNAS